MPTRPVLVHLTGGCRKRKRHAWTDDPLAVSCPDCLRRRRWRRVARRVINQSTKMRQPELDFG